MLVLGAWPRAGFAGPHVLGKRAPNSTQHLAQVQSWSISSPRACQMSNSKTSDSARAGQGQPRASNGLKVQIMILIKMQMILSPASKGCKVKMQNISLHGSWQDFENKLLIINSRFLKEKIQGIKRR